MGDSVFSEKTNLLLSQMRSLESELIAVGYPNRLFVVFCRRSGLRQEKAMGKMPGSGCKQPGNWLIRPKGKICVVMTDWGL